MQISPLERVRKRNMPHGGVKETSIVVYVANSLSKEDDNSAARSHGASMEKHLEGTGQRV